MRVLRVIRSLRTATGGPAEGIRQQSLVHARYGHTIDVLTLETETQNDPDSGFREIALGPSIGTYGFNTRLIPWLRIGF